VKHYIRQYQIVFILTIGYLEVLHSVSQIDVKILSSLKSILSNVHRNYLVFVEFLFKNLSEDQRAKLRVCEDIMRILNERPTNNIQYK